MCRYLMGEFFKDPVSCLTLASFLITNTGEGGASRAREGGRERRARAGGERGGAVGVGVGGGWVWGECMGLNQPGQQHSGAPKPKTYVTPTLPPDANPAGQSTNRPCLLPSLTHIFFKPSTPSTPRAHSPPPPQVMLLASTSVTLSSCASLTLSASYGAQ